MTNPPPNDEPQKVLPYATPMQSTDPERKAFGNVWGNISVGLVAFLASCFVGPFLASSAKANSGWAYMAMPLATLALGATAACFPRYRGVLIGMLLVVIGVPLLIFGLCFLR